MKLIDENGTEYEATKIYRFPKMSPHRGRTWDKFKNYIDGLAVWMWLDTTWGRFFYFTYSGDDWKIPLMDVVKLKGKEFTEV